MNIDILAAPLSQGKTQRRPGLAFWAGNPPLVLYSLALLALFALPLADAVRWWLRDEYQAHGIFIVPLSLALCWVQRDALAQIRPRPSAWGLPLLGLGLMICVGSWLLRVDTQMFTMWSLALTLAGSILLWHGAAMWRAVRFPVLFLLMAGGIPDRLTQPASALFQRLSSTGASVAMKALGLPILQTGNVIEVPGCRLEVADVCSGIKKMVAMLAFSLLYGYVFSISGGKRVLLVLSTVPIVLFANMLRVAGLIGVSYLGGLGALHIAHDWAEIFVLIVAFFLFIGVGKLLGCKTLRFSL
jgi:exosortase